MVVVELLIIYLSGKKMRERPITVFCKLFNLLYIKLLKKTVAQVCKTLPTCINLPAQDYDRTIQLHNVSLMK